jgi:hypothetical protein
VNIDPPAEWAATTSSPNATVLSRVAEELVIGLDVAAGHAPFSDERLQRGCDQHPPGLGQGRGTAP